MLPRAPDGVSVSVLPTEAHLMYFDVILKGDFAIVF